MKKKLVKLSVVEVSYCIPLSRDISEKGLCLSSLRTLTTRVPQRQSTREQEGKGDKVRGLCGQSEGQERARGQSESQERLKGQ